MASSDSLSTTAVIGGACSQSGANLEGGVGGKSGGLGDGSSPVGSRSEAPAGVWGRSPPEAGAFSKIHNLNFMAL